jgi:hypothetical protein
MVANGRDDRASIPAAVSIAEIPATDAGIASRPALPKHQIQHESSDQQGGEHAPRILLAIGEDSRGSRFRTATLA